MVLLQTIVESPINPTNSVEQIPNNKHQITNKLQIAIYNDPNLKAADGNRFEFGILVSPSVGC
jgi:hypothetical protein